MLPEHLKTTALKCHYWLDKGLEWCYLRYTAIEDLKGRESYTLVYHVKCSNNFEAKYSRLYRNSKCGIICTGCGKEPWADVTKQATAVWMMERTQYGG